MLVTGASGMVGSRFVELNKNNFKFLSPDESELDMTNSQKTKKYIKNTSPDTIVHFAAFTDVGAAEEQRDDKKGSCWKINILGTKNLVNAIDKSKTHFIQISTDMVFPGSKKDPGPYSEDHKPETNSNKLTWYGFTKAQAEVEVKKALSDSSTILRIIYPVRSKFEDKLDYLRKPLKLFDEGKLHPMFSDQVISIAYIDEISMTLNKIIKDKKYGVFHASSSNTTSPYELVDYLIENARGEKDAVKKSSLASFLKKVDNPVRYPMFGGLKVEKTQKTLKISFSTWKEIVDKLAI